MIKKITYKKMFFLLKFIVFNRRILFYMKKLFIIRVRINEGIIDRGDKMDQLIASHGWWIDMLTCQQKKKS